MFVMVKINKPKGIRFLLSHKGKEYIHSIGGWNNYIKYLQENLKIGEN